ncbi:ABC transporter ATP-binding protein [Mesomycoplasma hyorhinis]|uniref:ABC transporter ATP-binding protein n=1 Tax=Mesomycoplasma hyorhinis TaxID=2100 RepID=UPI001C059456|nr:ABC transporter ATP-binding protein [Mesomycoplasma hyorhinis]UVT32614.1 ABC transporter ATP-binding protein [Mesomycoplasma hyorhinis]UVT33282.1 ABC transporter ATP-binding protein [Mesomycoplasma hyorhinis]UVT33954.1 ABC transporter ATP-binding protein [Mesomycoplasma hyorhinis]
MKKNKFTSLITNFFKNFTRSNKSEKVNEIIAKNLNSDFQLSKKQLKLVRWANNHPLPKFSKKISKNTADNIIEFFKVSKYYLFGSVVAEVFKDISFSIKRGEFAILYGKSGSGKSTILNLMSGLDRASGGDIVVANENLSYLTNAQLTEFRRDNISFIFQNYNLLQSINGYDNVQVGSHLQKDKDKKIDIAQLFKEFEVDEIKFKYPSQMSGGQQQRISILRALAKNGEIIFADEPTGALDEKNTAIVLKVLKYINEKYKTTIVMVSHDISMIPLADRIIKLENKQANIIEQKGVSFEEFLKLKDNPENKA